MKSCYDGEDIRVFYNEGPVDLLVITFTHMSKSQPPRLFGVGYLEKRDIAYIAFQSLANHWWQTAEMDTAINLIRPIIARYKRVCTYGTSMGAHAALTFSKKLSANRVIAVVPQYSIHPDLAPFEKRWRKERESAVIYYEDPIAGVCQDAEKIIIYDPFHKVDARHIPFFREIPNTYLVKASFCKHYPLKAFSSIGVLSELLESLLLPSLELSRVRELTHNSWAQSAAYRVRLAFKKYSKISPSQARYLIRSVTVEDLADDWESLLIAGRIYRRSGNLHKALVFVQASISVDINLKNITFAKALLNGSTSVRNN